MIPTSTSSRVPLSFTGADLLGLSRLGLDAAVGVMNIAESMHQTISSRAGFLGQTHERTSGVAGTVYGVLRGTTRAASQGLEAMLGGLIGSAGADAAAPEREAAVAALNGLWGDHLVETSNSLAIKMNLRVAGRALDLTPDSLASQLPVATGKVLVLVHGLCLNDLQWTRRDGHDHGVALARDLGFTPVYLHYNTGLHISQNGRQLADLLERLLAAWPVPVEELVLLGHSMGGLVARSACHHAERDGQAWLRSVRRMVFLGTPHHGAPLERGGHVVDKLFGVSPYLAPFGSLGKARSAGITDLRFGNVHDSDWQGRNRHDQVHDDRRPVPLPTGIAGFAVAATTSEHPDALRSYLIGDGLVPVASALGKHSDPALDLGLSDAQRFVATSANHFDLLSRADIYDTMRGWLR